MPWRCRRPRLFSSSARPAPPPDHTRFKELQGPSKPGLEVIRIRLICHNLELAGGGAPQDPAGCAYMIAALFFIHGYLTKRISPAYATEPIPQPTKDYTP